MTLLLALAVTLLATLLGITIVGARSMMRKLADGDFDVPFFSDEASQIRRRQSALETKIALLERQRTIDARMLNGLSEGVLAIDCLRRVVLANRRFAELFDAEKAVGKPVLEVVRIAAVFEALDRALTGSETVERFSTRSGIAERTFEMRALPLASEDIAAVAIFIDVTRLDRLEAIRRNFISDFSHEVRTPLAGLRSAVEMYEGVEHLSASEEEQLRRIMSRQLLRLERLVDDLSELSRIESGDLHLARDRIDLRKLAEDLCEDFSDRAAQHDIRFAISGQPLFVCADALRIQQALSNLIDNAIKYGGDGNAIEIEIAERAGMAEVRVRDHGEGIAEAEQEKIFRRFYRIDKSRSQETGGTGLGLAIAKHIVLQQNGSIDVESEGGKGSTFIVRLPRRLSAV